MCLAVPGKIVSIIDNQAVIEYGVEKRKATLLDANYAIGDYVIVQGGVVAMKVDKEEAEISLRQYCEALGQSDADNA